MPVLFVHGVNNRISDPDYEVGRAAKEAYINKFLGPSLGMRIEEVSFPYWGDLGVTPHWGGASLPYKKTIPLAAGLEATSSALDVLAADIAKSYAGKAVNLAELTRNKGMSAAVDFIWDVVGVAAKSEDDCNLIADLYNESIAYAERDAYPLWVRERPHLDNNAFLDRLIVELTRARGGQHALAASDKLESARELLRRIAALPSASATSLLLAATRRSANAHASLFIGDVFEYLSSRSRDGKSAKIVSRISEAIMESSAAAEENEEPLLLIGHSLGGVIAFDILNNFLSDITVDYFVSVGSQIALFAELDQYASKMDPSSYANPRCSRAARSANIRTWLNVYDLNDIFSYAAKGVFSGVDDYEFDTGYGLLSAHGGYFKRPSFYRRLAIRLKP